MLEFVRIQRFKTLADAQFPLAYLNLFTGLNGMGKSSLLQVLLLLRQSHERNLLPRGLQLNGDYVNLGTGIDVLSTRSNEESIAFHLKWKEKPVQQFRFEYQAQADLLPLSQAVTSMSQDESLFGRNFQYLSADRIGPKTHYELSDFSLQQKNSIGKQGEYAAHFIADNQAKPLAIKQLKHEQAITDTFLDNLNAWMSHLAPGLSVRTHLQRTLNLVTLSYAFRQNNDMTADFKPQNVGFGLTYALPVVTALLRAKPGDMVIIENPESHLHPSAQSNLGRLCALAAASGVQLFLETHSDHFLNGIRVAVRNHLVQPNQVAIFYLERNVEDPNHTTVVHSPRVDDLGRLSFWPEGFFDEWSKNLEQLL